MNNDQCVYALLDSRKNIPYVYKTIRFDFEPFYVGRGSEKRPYKHLKAVQQEWSAKVYSRNIHKNRKISKMLREGFKPIVIIIKKCLSYVEANKIEMKFIAEIGRSDLKKGPLTNKTDGGDGTVGWLISEKTKKRMSLNHADVRGDKNPFFGKTHSDEFKKWISERNKVRYKGINNPMYGIRRFGKDSPHWGRKHSEETKKLISFLRKGKKLSVEVRKRISEGNKNPSIDVRERMSAATSGINNPRARYYYCQKGDNGVVECVMRKGLESFCKEIGISFGKVRKVLNKDVDIEGWKFHSKGVRT